MRAMPDAPERLEHHGLTRSGRGLTPISPRRRVEEAARLQLGHSRQEGGAGRLIVVERERLEPGGPIVEAPADLQPATLERDLVDLLARIPAPRERPRLDGDRPPRVEPLEPP